MGLRGPQPKKERKKTGVVRIAPDLAIMVTAICRHLNKTTVELMDEIAREDIEREFEKIRPILQQLAKQSPVAKNVLQEVDEVRKQYQAALKEEAERAKR